MIDLSNDRRRRQIAFLGLTEADVAHVKQFRDELREAAHRVMDQLPRLIGEEPETRRIIEQYSIERHRRKVMNHMFSLGDGLVDDAYVEKRIAVGEMHNEVGLAPHWYMSAFQLLFTEFIDVLTETNPGDTETLVEGIKSFGKLFNLDMQLILEAYFASYERTIQHFAYYDDLTGHANLALFEDRLQSAVRRALRTGSKTAVLLVHLNRIHRINETFGHKAGNDVLQSTGRRLAETIRDGDTLARLGGNEFAILLSDVQSHDAPARVAERIAAVMKEPFRLNGSDVSISPSIGIALCPDDSPDGRDLLSQANIAMNEAKRTGAAYRFYTTNMHDDVVRRLTMEAALRAALERDEFVLHYQPQFDVHGRRVIGFEALLRWHRNHETWMRPDQFIPLAEETELIVPIGEWVLRTALAQLKAWHDAGHGELTMGVNLSPVQLRQPDLAERVQNMLEEAGVSPLSLQLEITESVTVEGARQPLQTLAKLRDMGVSIAVDDFGTGYSSLAYLKDLPLDALKIDRSFIAEMTTESQAAGIVDMMVALARNFDLKVTAEGVETEEQLNELQQRGCHRAQGFYLGKPMPAAEAEQRFLTPA